MSGSHFPVLIESKCIHAALWAMNYFPLYSFFPTPIVRNVLIIPLHFFVLPVLPFSTKNRHATYRGANQPHYFYIPFVKKKKFNSGNFFSGTDILWNPREDPSPTLTILNSPSLDGPLCFRHTLINCTSQLL